jgi:AraC-like DNA-binding protein
MNDTLFAKSFYFYEVHRGKHAFTDARCGSVMHYIAYMMRGSCRIVGENEEITAHEGEFFYIPKGLPYRSYWQDTEDVTFISLGFPFFPNADQRAYPLQCIPSGEEALALLSRVPLGQRTTCDGIAAFYTLLAHLLPSMREDIPCRSRRIVALAERLLWENTALRPVELARRAGVCESALYAAFEKASEETPHEMRERILFEKAKDLLFTTDLPIEEISERLGFCSCAYFRKRFKSRFGLSPREMRKSEPSL